MIGFPGDVLDGIQDVHEAIHSWNTENSEAEDIVLLPKDWTKNTHPSLMGRPQEIVNRQLADKADMLIAVFRGKLGTPTGKAASGTAEEIDEFYYSGRPVQVYFSREVVSASLADDLKSREERDRLRAFEAKIRTMGIYGSFDSISELKDSIKKDIYANIREIKSKKFVISPRKMKIGKYVNLKDIGKIDSENWHIKAGEISDYIVRTSLQSPVFRTRFGISDLILIYQIVLDNIGVKFHSVNNDYVIRQLFSELIEDEILRNVRNSPGYNYGRTLRDISSIRQEVNGKKSKIEVYYGFAKNSHEGLDEYSAAVEKLRKKGLDIKLFSEIRGLLDGGSEVRLPLPKYVLESLERYNPNELKRQVDLI